MRQEQLKNMDELLLFKKIKRAVEKEKLESLVDFLVREMKFRIWKKSYVEWDRDGSNLKSIPTNHALLVLSASFEIGEHYPEHLFLALSQAIYNIRERYLWEYTKPEKSTSADGELEEFGRALFYGQTPEAVALFKKLQGEAIALKPELEDLLFFFGIIEVEETTRRQMRNLGHKAIAVEKAYKLVIKCPKNADYFYDWMVRYLSSQPVILPLYDELTANYTLSDKWCGNAMRFDDDVFELIYDGLYHNRGIITTMEKALNAGYSPDSVRKSLALSALRFMIERRIDSTFYFIHLFNYLHASEQYFQRHRNLRSLQALFVQGLYCERVLNERCGMGNDQQNYEVTSKDELVKEILSIDATVSGGHDLKFLSSVLEEMKTAPAWAEEYYLKALTKHLSLARKSHKVLEILQKL